MEIKDIKQKERKTVAMSIRTTKEISDWMKKNSISPTFLFNRSAKELMKRSKK